MADWTISTTRIGSDQLHRVANSRGMTIELSSLGASLRSCTYGGRELTLGFTDSADYHRNGPYFAVTVGRFANRIGAARTTVDGKALVLEANDGPNHLHGGSGGYATLQWAMEPVETTVRTTGAAPVKAAGALFRLVSPDGDQGYPGEVTVETRILLTEDNQLVFSYQAQSTATSPLNLTNHAYWNLAGEGSGSIHDHVLRLGTLGWLDVDSGSIPTGAFIPQAGTPWDFTRPAPLAPVLSPRTATGRKGWTQGIDHNFILDPAQPPQVVAVEGTTGLGVRTAAVVTVEKGPEGSPLTMEVLTSLPGVQVYTANYLDGQPGRKGPQVLHSGLCLETQLFPDAPNKGLVYRDLGARLGYKPEETAGWDALLRPGQTWEALTVHRFS